jgi:hypothetical protein
MLHPEHPQKKSTHLTVTFLVWILLKYHGDGLCDAVYTAGRGVQLNLRLAGESGLYEYVGG